MQDNSNIIDQDYIVTQLMRLIELCAQHGCDLDVLMTEARFRLSGQPDIEESG